MKTIFISIFLTALMLIILTPSTSFALPKDTVVVSALPPGNINNFINSDTTASGFTKPNRVYLLKPTGVLDTVFYMTAPVSVKGNVFIVGYLNPKTGHPPVIAPSIAADNTSIGNFFSPQGDDTLLLKGIYFLGTRTDGIANTGRFVAPSGDSNVFYFDHCILENISGAGTPNLFDTWNHDHNSFYVTNCEFRNNQDDNPQNPGFAWIDPGTYPCDTARFWNNTFFLTGGYVLGSSGYGATYLDFQHNTIFMTGQGGAFDLYQMHNAVIKNNIFFGVSCAGYPQAWYNNTPGSWGSAVIPLDSLRSLAAAPYNMKEADRKLTISNNAYFWPKKIVDNWTAINVAGIASITPIRPPDFINTQPGMLTNKTSWPNINVSANDSTDPGFDATLVATAAGNMAAFVDTLWHNNQTAAGMRPYINPMSDPPSLTSAWPNVAANWALTQGYPVSENLRYSNSALQHAGSDGKALGDLNWFPEQLTGVIKEPTSLPTSFSLGQNYPNPFNPSTNITFDLNKRSHVELKVYNIIGQLVATLADKDLNSGEYTVNFNAHNLASGIYFYRLTTDTFTDVKKMILMK